MGGFTCFNSNPIEELWKLLKRSTHLFLQMISMNFEKDRTLFEEFKIPLKIVTILWIA
jgi:hypothetical protein